MKHVMPILPYSHAALAPAMSAETIEFHYGRHLQTYVDNLNRLIKGTLYEDMELEEMVCKASGAVFNNAAQTWNHTFFFEALTPRPRSIDSALGASLTSRFGSLGEFKQQFIAAATSLFGSGWTWLVESPEGSLEIVNTSGAGNPLTEGQRPLLVADVWEHAYYIDYRNRRADYLEALWGLIDWDVVACRFRGTCSDYYL